MPLTVPQGRSPDAGSMPLVPSESDLWMALAIMQKRGAFGKMDPTKQGQVEDRSKMPPEELLKAETQSRKDAMLGYPELEKGMAESSLAKAVSPPARIGRVGPKVARIVGPERESLGVSGGSR